jgi:drug/metabolite transporter (DMT)-like permease
MYNDFVNYLYAIGAAVLFGAAAPVSKTLLGSLKPYMLASLCYFGSGFALAAWKLARRAPKAGGEPALAFKDWPYIAGFILAGGVLAPILLFKGLQLTSSSGASAMLNLELIFTSLIASVFFKEYTGLKFWLAAALVAAGAALLNVDFNSFSFALDKGYIMVALSAFFWGVDNNLTAKLSIKDPAAIALVKGLAGGSINLALALQAGEFVPASVLWACGLALGAVSYGISLVFFILAMRGLGAARAGAVFGTYPFFGAALSVIFLREPLTAALAAAFILMALGFYLVVSERHMHEHTHERLEHEHRHSHDDAHHTHGHGDLACEAEHMHFHTHTPSRHRHQHAPDSHHGHTH